MALTILSIPLIFIGAFIKIYAVEATRCVGVFGKGGFCFEASSDLPELIKYGCVLAGFALLYAGRMQIKKARGLQ